MSVVQDLPAPTTGRGLRARVAVLAGRHRSISIIVGMAIVSAVLPGWSR